MPKCPEEVEKAIIQAAKHYEIANGHTNVIEAWFEKISMSEDDGYRDTLIDYVQQSNNPELAIKLFED